MKTGSLKRVSLPGHVLKREIDGESVILNLNTERYYGLDDVGTHMLAALANSASIAEAYETLLKEYDVDADKLRDDLETLVGKLTELGLIELSLSA